MTKSGESHVCPRCKKYDLELDTKPGWPCWKCPKCKWVHGADVPPTPGVKRVTAEHFMRIVTKSTRYPDATCVVTMPNGEWLPIYPKSLTIVDGTEPDICEVADPTIQLPMLRKIVAKLKLPAGKTVHWVGDQSKLATICGCYRDGVPTDDRPDGQLAATVTHLRNWIAQNAGAATQKAKELLQKVKVQVQVGRQALRILQAEGVYQGFARETPRRYLKTGSIVPKT
jgi:ribosomal protein L37AE/L43A